MTEVDVTTEGGVQNGDVKGRPTMAGPVDKVIEVKEHKQVTLAIVGAGQRGQVSVLNQELVEDR